MLVSVTPLGASRARGVAGAVAATVNYLDGRRAPQRDNGRSLEPGSDPVLEAADPVAYYADSSDSPGMWTGRGINGIQIRGTVGRDQLARMLLGQDPRTGRQLVARARRVTATAPRPHTQPDELLSLADAARQAHVGTGYLRRMARIGEAAMVRRTVEVMAGAPLTLPPEHWLAAERTGVRNGWRVNANELERFMCGRTSRPVVIAYDVTFSAPKSVSVLWAAGDADVQAEIVRSVDIAVTAGVDYLEQHASYVRVKGLRSPADGILAASYLHTTSRALDPQLHRHVIIANMAAGADGSLRALDGTPLFVHAKTAGYLAAAELRHQLSSRLGVAWQPVANGTADIAGVPDTAIAMFSTRAADISEATSAVGLDGPKARQVAAFATRAAKEDATDPVALRARWLEQLAAIEFDQTVLAKVVGVATPTVVADDEVKSLFRHLASAAGVTEQATTFDRRDVIQQVAEWAGNRLPAPQITDLADQWLASHHAIRLAPTPAERIPADRRARDRWLAAGVRYTTPEMLALEAWLEQAFVAGRDAGVGVVPAAITDGVLASRPIMGHDQAAVVRAVTSSAHLVQCVVGPAGTGKTFAIEAAARAWEAAGYDVLGAAVGGTAAEVLGSATGIPSTTIASLLARLETTTASVVTDRTVIVVDEASTLGNRDLARLIAHAQRSGSALRLVGDAAQHSAVAAGGAWRYLVDRHPDDAPALAVARRQAAPPLSEVRLALGEYRAGQIHEALARLVRDERIVEAATPDALLDALVADWYADRTNAPNNASASSMIAEHHSERRELNRRARVLLTADGTLHGPSLEIAGIEFRAGDEVIARAQDRSLRPPGGDRTTFVRNGTRGVVAAVRASGLVVDFAGRGLIDVPRSFLECTVRPGVTGGLVHSYCLTSHAAQGETYDAARHLATDRSSRPGVYVGLTRGRREVRLYIVRARQLDPDPVDDALPRLPRVATALESLAAQLASHGPEQLATETDPTAVPVATLRSTCSLDQLAAAADHEPHGHAAGAVRAIHHDITARAICHPPLDLVDHLGARPAGGPDRRLWDRAVGLAAVYRAHWGNQRPDPAAADHQRGWWTRVQTASHAADLSRHTAQPAAQLVRARATETDAAELRVIDEALGVQVGRAVRHPAPYLLAALGPPPPIDTIERERWSGLARRVEHYRHHALGLQPIDGPIVGHPDPVIAAIGPRPDDPRLAHQWTRLRAAITAPTPARTLTH